MTERASGWLKTAITVAVILVPVVAGYGALSARVAYVKERQDLVIQSKADKEIVADNQRVIIAWLERLDAKLDRHIEARR
jgi:hypothetical protein